MRETFTEDSFLIYFDFLLKVWACTAVKPHTVLQYKKTPKPNQPNNKQAIPPTPNQTNRKSYPRLMDNLNMHGILINLQRYLCFFSIFQ